MKRKRQLSPKHVHIAKQLTLLASICLILIFLLFTLTQSRVRHNELAYLKKSLSKVLPPEIKLTDFDNDVLASKQQIGNKTVYPACKRGQLYYALMEVQTYEGYSGLIRLLVSIDSQHHTVFAVRPLFHQETPGLGDQIDTDKSDWLQQFSLPLNSKHIALAKDGGKIDAITGATITSRAVTNLLQADIFSLDEATLSELCTKQSL